MTVYIDRKLVQLSKFVFGKYSQPGQAQELQPMSCDFSHEVNASTLRNLELNIPNLIATLDENLDSNKKEDRDKAIRILSSKFRNVDAFTSWLKSHGIGWSSWAWPG